LETFQHLFTTSEDVANVFYIRYHPELALGS
jgi:hypothetical protein